jgi:7,8-dihydropterin-6-yl-methyl-4-(beta-D-ribofuranosyl)aminobenzene 5'-phosphate synthase
MSLKITTLSDNCARMGDYFAEWGLSLLLEFEGTKILLDTGSGHSTLHNAEIAGIDLRQVDKIVLSHGHADHTGGLREVLRHIGREIEVIAHPDIWQSKYHRRKDDPEKFIGIPFQRQELESLGARFNLVTSPLQICANIWTSGEVPMLTPYESTDSGLFVKERESVCPDQVLDDMALFVLSGEGLTVILGCAHRGMINALQHAQKVTGVQKINAVIGGSHLIGAPEERLWQTISALKELEVGQLGLSHCTDLPAIGVLAQEFGEKFIFNKAGSSLELE